MKNLLLRFIRFYQRTSFFHKRIFCLLFLSDRSCRFLPTCSDYAYQAINRYGIIQGGRLAISRIFRCHPWQKGGWDPLK